MTDIHELLSGESSAPKPEKKPGASPLHATRRQRLAYWLTAAPSKVIIILAVLVIAGGSAWTYYLEPRMSQAQPGPAPTETEPANRNEAVEYLTELVVEGERTLVLSTNSGTAEQVREALEAAHVVLGNDEATTGDVLDASVRLRSAIEQAYTIRTTPSPTPPPPSPSPTPTPEPDPTDEPEPTQTPEPTPSKTTAKPSPKPTTTTKPQAPPKTTPPPATTKPPPSTQTVSLTLTCEGGDPVTFTGMGNGNVQLKVTGAQSASKSGNGSVTVTVTGTGRFTATVTAASPQIGWSRGAGMGSCTQS